jgi:predicted ATPase/class 3 adenylate cyclase
MPESAPAPASPSTATVTLLFTDIEGSTAMWEQDAARMSQALCAHDALARRAVDTHQGTVVKMTGDGMQAVFATARDALAATVDLQRALGDPDSTGGVPLRVRCGLHAGVVERRDNDYFGSHVNRAARIMSAAHGGQVLLSQAVVEHLCTDLPESVSLLDLGNVRLKDLATAEHVYQVVHPQLRNVFPALRSLEATPNNLPQQATSFVGRSPEVAALARLLAKSRLLTLTGSGGCGKTRLGLQIAADALEQHPDGVWLAEFAPLADPALVAQTTATVLGLKEESGKPITRTLVEHLKDKTLLLLLDNCEHLLDACARLCETVLRQCPGVRILATSREALAIGGEQAYRVPSLSLPDTRQAYTPESLVRFEAVQLFADRAVLARHDFLITERNAAAVASICYRLDGIPLALELAAARLRSLSVEEIDGRLNERFRLLTGGSRAALPRQQTLRSLIDWSYDLLHDPARQLLQRLSVFSGGWTLPAAERICAGGGMDEIEVLDQLTSLADKSLVATNPLDGDTRFRLVETVRQYAREKLLEGAHAAAVRARHLDYFLSLAEEAEPKLQGAEQASWLRRLEQEHDNVRAALEWSLATRGERHGLRLCGALQRFWITRGHYTEGRGWCARVLETAGAESPTLLRAKVQNCAGLLAYHQVDFVAARASLEESLALRRQLGDRRGVGISLNNLGMVALDQRDLPAARRMHEESLAIARELGNRNGIARSLGNLGMVASEQRDFETARTLFDECLSIMRELADREGIAIALHSLGGNAYEQANYAVAYARYNESLAILHELGHRGRMAYTLEELGAVVAAQGDVPRAAQLWGAAQRLREEVGSPAPAEDSAFEARVDAARATLHDDPAFDLAWQEGRALTAQQAIELAAA